LSTCSALIDALNTVASYIAPSNILGDLSGNLASLNPVPGTLTEIQLSSGGNASVSVPATNIDGKLIKVSISGYTTILGPTPPNPSPSLSLYMNSLALIGMEMNNTSETFCSVSTFVWNSSNNLVSGYSGGFSAVGPIGNTTVLPSSGNFVFSLFAEDSIGSNNSSITVNQFKVELV